MYNSKFRVDLLPNQILNFKEGYVVRLRRAEYFVAVFDNELHGSVFGMHVSHFSFHAETRWGLHDGRRKDHGKILRCHL
jgi:hypothetical protein